MPMPVYAPHASQARGLTRSQGVRIVVFIMIAAIMISAVVIFVSGDFGIGYKFTVSGDVRLGGLGDGSWYIENIQISEPIADKSILEFGFGLLDTSSIDVVCELQGKSVTDGLGTFSTIGGTKHFTCEFRHILPGYYSGEIYVYENMCGLIPINCDTVEQANEPFSIDIDIIGD